MNVYDHPAYNDAIKHAAYRAGRANSRCNFIVYWMYSRNDIAVLPSGDARPHNSTIVCIAQRWDDTTVQLRYSGARANSSKYNRKNKPMTEYGPFPVACAT